MRATLLAALLCLSLTGCAWLGIGNDHPDIDTAKERLVLAYAEVRSLAEHGRTVCNEGLLDDQTCKTAYDKIAKAKAILDEAAVALKNDETIGDYLERAMTLAADVDATLPEP